MLKKFQFLIVTFAMNDGVSIQKKLQLRQVIFENKSLLVIWLFVKFVLVSFFFLKVSMAQFWPRFFLTWFEAHSVLSGLIML